MSYRIIIEDQNGLHQAILNETDYIYMFDIKNARGCDLSVHGNSEKLSQMYDLLTHFLISKDPGIILRVISAWDNGRGAAHD